ncbi:MAG: hypothetical protein ACXAD7_18615 [Candidatus Kariarchaeaceae archaeon]|jgi:hypothetical protein
MSSKLLPDIETSSVNGAISFLLLSILLLAFSAIGNPISITSFSSVFGLLFLIGIILSVINSFPILKKFQYFIGRYPSFNVSTQGGYDQISRFKPFNEMVANQTSKIVLGFGLTIIYIFFWISRDDFMLFLGISNTSSINESGTVTFLIVSILATVILQFVSLFLLYRNIVLPADELTKNHKYAYNMFVYLNLRKHKKTNEFRSNLLTELSDLIQNKDWDGLNDKLKATIYPEIIKMLNEYANNVKTFQKVFSTEITKVENNNIFSIGFPEWNITLNKYDNSGQLSQLETGKEIGWGIKKPRLQELDIIELVFGKNHTANKTGNDVQKFMRDLNLVDSYLVLIMYLTVIFPSVTKGKEYPIIINGKDDPIKIQVLTVDNYPSFCLSLSILKEFLENNQFKRYGKYFKYRLGLKYDTWEDITEIRIQSSRGGLMKDIERTMKLNISELMMKLIEERTDDQFITNHKSMKDALDSLKRYLLLTDESTHFSSYLDFIFKNQKMLSVKPHIELGKVIIIEDPKAQNAHEILYHQLFDKIGKELYRSPITEILRDLRQCRYHIIQSINNQIDLAQLEETITFTTMKYIYALISHQKNNEFAIEF